MALLSSNIVFESEHMFASLCVCAYIIQWYYSNSTLLMDIFGKEPIRKDKSNNQPSSCSSCLCSGSIC